MKTPTYFPTERALEYTIPELQSSRVLCCNLKILEPKMSYFELTDDL